jgi:hypothetical protein
VTQLLDIEQHETACDDHDITEQPRYRDRIVGIALLGLGVPRERGPFWPLVALFTI